MDFIKFILLILLCSFFLFKIGMIERGEVEVGLTSFYANSERAEVVDFSPILDYAEYCCIPN